MDFFKLSIAPCKATTKSVPPPASICLSKFKEFNNSFFGESLYIFSISSLKVNNANWSSSFKFKINLLRASFANSILDIPFIFKFIGQLIDPDISKAIDISIGSFIFSPSYFDLTVNPIKYSFLLLKGFLVFAWDNSKFNNNEVSFDCISK